MSSFPVPLSPASDVVHAYPVNLSPTHSSLDSRSARPSADLSRRASTDFGAAGMGPGTRAQSDAGTRRGAASRGFSAFPVNLSPSRYVMELYPYETIYFSKFCAI